MGYILPEIYKSIVENNSQELPKIFIETGTFKGGVPHRIMERTGELDTCFDKYYTIELGEDICRIASKRYKHFEENDCKPSYHMIHTDDQDMEFNKVGRYFNNRLNLINGDSGVEIKQLLNEINEPICFWLDAHSGADKYARGEEDVPLLQELKAIKEHQIKNHIIAIDDAHLFGKRQTNKKGELVCDYTDVTYEKIKQRILDINPDYNVGLYAPYGMSMLIAYVV